MQPHKQHTGAHPAIHALASEHWQTCVVPPEELLVICEGLWPLLVQALLVQLLESCFLVLGFGVVVATQVI